MCNRLEPYVQGVGHSQHEIRVSNYALQESKSNKMHTKVKMDAHKNHNAIPMAKNMCVQLLRFWILSNFNMN